MAYKIPHRAVNPLMHFRRVASMAGMGWVLREGVRNSVRWGKATRVEISIGDDPAVGGLAISILDDGKGNNADGRDRFSNKLGHVNMGGGNGTGIRDTALTVCQVLECYTISVDEPNVVYYIRLPIVEWFLRIACDDWHGQWQSFSRMSERNPIPDSLKSGTLIRLSDFRRSFFDAPFDESKMVDTSKLITPERAVQAIKLHLREYVDIVRINDKPIKLGALPGYKLWKPKPVQREHLGTVSGHVNIASDPEGHRLTIGGTTSTIGFDKFLEDISEQAPDLAKRIPVVFATNRQLIGAIRIEALEPYSAQQRQCLLPDFYSMPNAQRMLDELCRIAEVIEKGLVRYAKRTSSDVTRACIGSVAARLNKAAGVSFVSGTDSAASGGASDSSGPTSAATSESVHADTSQEEGVQQSVSAPAEPALEPLIVSPRSVRLEQWRGEGERDETTVSVQNPIGDETFVWNDFDSNLVSDPYGALVTIAASRKEGTHLVTVQSKEHPSRMAHVDVNIHKLEENPEDPGATPFKLIPETMNIVIGEERPVKVHHQGETSGDYVWGWHAPGEGIVCIEQPGNRRLMVRAVAQGKYTVTCRDKRDGTLSRTTIINVRPPKVKPPEEEDPTPSDDASSDAAGDGDGLKASPITTSARPEMYPGVIGAISFAVELDDQTFAFTAEATPAINSTFYADSENRQISIGDRMASAAALDNRQREMHVLHAMAHGVRSIMLSTGELDPRDARQHERLVDFILSKGIPRG